MFVGCVVVNKLIGRFCRPRLFLQAREKKITRKKRNCKGEGTERERKRLTLTSKDLLRSTTVLPTLCRLLSNVRIYHEPMITSRVRRIFVVRVVTPFSPSVSLSRPPDKMRENVFVNFKRAVVLCLAVEKFLRLLLFCFISGHKFLSENQC